MKKLFAAIVKAPRVYICGNGGSAANAIHWANDLIAAGIRAHALTADVATLTAIANDYDYGQVFSRQLTVLALPGDLLIALSGSGRSENILMALRQGRNLRMITCLITGAYAPEVLDTKIWTDVIVRAGKDMQEAEEYQLILIHEFIKGRK